VSAVEPAGTGFPKQERATDLEKKNRVSRVAFGRGGVRPRIAGAIARMGEPRHQRDRPARRIRRVDRRFRRRAGGRRIRDAAAPEQGDVSGDTAGHTINLRAFALGFSGGPVASGDAVFRFE
jgi:hypothetical protein